MEEKDKQDFEDEIEEKETCDCDESCNCGCQDGEECSCEGDCCKDDCKCEDACEEDFLDEEEMPVYGDGCECGCPPKHKHKHRHEKCEHKHGEECEHEHHGKCGEHKPHECEHEHSQDDKAAEYLQMAQRLKADFENYRKHVGEELDRARNDGAESVIEAFLPSLDTFKEAKKSISDDGVLQGINMIEDKILEALAALNVEKIEAVGQPFDPHKHNVVAITKDENAEDGIILEEFQSGWVRNGKVIRYSKVVVNKKD